MNPQLTVHCDDKEIHLSIDRHPLLSVPFTLPYLYSLDDTLVQTNATDILAHGLELQFPQQAPAKPLLRLELLLHCIYLSLTYHIYPNLSAKSPHSVREDFEHHTNSILNIPHSKDLCNCQILGGYAKDRLAVLISSGPSIDYEMLHRLKGRSVIIAVGRVLPRLLAHGIVPDFLYVQETSDHGWHAIFGDDTGTQIDTTLICNPVGPLHKYIHRVSHAYKSWKWYPFEMDSMPKLAEIAPSSTSGGYSLARVLGVNEILFMGSDCGEVHSGGELPDYVQPLATHLCAGKIPRTPFNNLGTFLLTIGSRTILTKNDYIASAQWLKGRIFRAATTEGIRFYEVSTTGMLGMTGLVPAPPQDLAPEPFPMPPLPHYNFRFEPDAYIKTLTTRYKFIQKHLNKHGNIPHTALVKPYNCVFTDVPNELTESRILTETERSAVLNRIEEIMGYLASASSATA